MTDSHVTEHLRTMADHNIELVFICELAEVHHRRPRFPAGWEAVGAGEFMIAFAPGWQARDAFLQAVWPCSSQAHPTKGWCEFPQAAR